MCLLFAATDTGIDDGGGHLNGRQADRRMGWLHPSQVQGLCVDTVICHPSLKVHVGQGGPLLSVGVLVPAGPCLDDAIHATVRVPHGQDMAIGLIMQSVAIGVLLHTLAEQLVTALRLTARWVTSGKGTASKGLMSLEQLEAKALQATEPFTKYVCKKCVLLSQHFPCTLVIRSLLIPWLAPATGPTGRPRASEHRPWTGTRYTVTYRTASEETNA